MNNLAVNSFSPAFCARTSIVAPENLISKKAKEALVAAGQKIGDDKSKITIKALNLNDKAFQIMEDAVFLKKGKMVIDSKKTTIPKEKMTAEKYAQTIMTRLAKYYNAIG